MSNYNLNIAGYIISIESAADGPDLVPSARFLRNICNENNSDIHIRVHSGDYAIPKGAIRVFNAPLVEETNGVHVKKSERFWNVYKQHNDLYIETILPTSSISKNAVLKYSLTDKNWELWITGDPSKADPLEYPLDGLVLYYLTVMHGDIFIHASGVEIAGKGYLFSGVSGKGKSTMAKLWENSGARVIHDDRLILRNKGAGYKMFNTPVYANDDPRSAPLNKIFIIEHGEKNKLIPVKGASGITQVMANCIQHNWDSGMIARLLGSVSIMCSAVPVIKLPFIPDRNVIDLILENE
jgi:hypothetical protein